MPFNMFPYSNLHNLNLDWVLNIVKTMAAAVEAAAGIVESYAARLQALENSRVSYAEQQQLTPTQQQTARGNIGAAPAIGVVMYNTEQALGDSYKQQARENIGAISADEIPAAADAVLYTEQLLTGDQQAQARENIGALGPGDLPSPQAAVLYTEQTLSAGQKSQARTNIGAAAAADIPNVSDVLRYSEQTLSAGQKSQARSNIEAASIFSVNELAQVDVYNIHIEETAADTFEITLGNLADAEEALNHGAPILINLETLNYGTLRGVASYTADEHGYVQEIKATLANLNAPGPGISTGYRILISNNGTSDVLICTSFEYKLMPSCTSSDRGKILTVASTGQPVWDAPTGPLVVTFSGTSDNDDAACDKTWAQIQAANGNIMPRFVTPDDDLLIGSIIIGDRAIGGSGISPAGDYWVYLIDINNEVSILPV